MKYIHGYDKVSKQYYVTIFEGGQTVTITFDTFEEQHRLMIILDGASNKRLDK